MAREPIAKAFYLVPEQGRSGERSMRRGRAKKRLFDRKMAGESSSGDTRSAKNQIAVHDSGFAGICESLVEIRYSGSERVSARVVSRLRMRAAQRANLSSTALISIRSASTR